jgi:protein-tyrosine phosphatase
MKILMVCLGNICRSPLAHGIMQHLAEKKGLGWQIDSAGTGNWHCGKAPDSRSIKVARSYGLDISTQKARQFQLSDFEEFDHILVMDQQNYKDVISLATHQEHINKVQLFIPNGFVPDPYWDDTQFKPVYDLIYARSEKLLQELLKSEEGTIR